MKKKKKRLFFNTPAVRHKDQSTLLNSLSDERFKVMQNYCNMSTACSGGWLFEPGDH